MVEDPVINLSSLVTDINYHKVRKHNGINLSRSAESTDVGAGNTCTVALVAPEGEQNIYS